MDCYESDCETWMTFQTIDRLMTKFNILRYDKFSREIGDVRQCLAGYPEIYNRLVVHRVNHDYRIRSNCLYLSQGNNSDIACWFSIFIAYWDEYRRDLAKKPGIEYVQCTAYMIVLHCLNEIDVCVDDDGNHKYPEILCAVVGQLYFQILDTIARSAELSAKYADQINRLKALAEHPQ